MIHYVMESKEDLLLDASCVPENATKLEWLNREVSSLGTEVSAGPSNLFVGMMSKELVVCPVNG